MCASLMVDPVDEVWEVPTNWNAFVVGYPEVVTAMVDCVLREMHKQPNARKDVGVCHTVEVRLAEVKGSRTKAHVVIDESRARSELRNSMKSAVRGMQQGTFECFIVPFKIYFYDTIDDEEGGDDDYIDFFNLFFVRSSALCFWFCFCFCFLRFFF